MFTLSKPPPMVDTVHIEAASDAGGDGDAWAWTMSVMYCGLALAVNEDASLRPHGHDFVPEQSAHLADCLGCHLYFKPSAGTDDEVSTRRTNAECQPVLHRLAASSRR